MGAGVSSDHGRLMMSDKAPLFNSLAGEKECTTEELEELKDLEEETRRENSFPFFLTLTYKCVLTMEASTENEIRNIIGVAQVSCLFSKKQT